MIYAITIFTALYFGAMYAIKGGWLGMIPGVHKLRDSSKILDRLLDGKVVSTIGVYAFVAVMLYYLGDMPRWWEYIFAPTLFSLCWLLGVSPSMGEEAGACGRIGRAWGPYIERGFGRSYGIKKALQRGVWLGAPFTLLTGLPHFLVLGALFPAIHFVMQQIHYMIHKTDSWKYAEPVVGTICIGVGVSVYVYKIAAAYVTLGGAF